VGGLGVWLRAEARRRWRGWLAVALIVGVGWGAVLTAAAGARRTQSAFPRFLALSRASNVLVGADQTGLGGFYAEVASLPQVAAAAPFWGLNTIVIDPPPPPRFAFGFTYFAVDDRYGREVNRPKLLRGRLPDPRSASEALVSPSFADPLRIDVGARVTMETGVEGKPGSPRAPGKRFKVTIVGIGVTQNEAFPISVLDKVQPLMLLTPAAFVALHVPQADAFDGVAIRLRSGAKVTDLQNSAEAALKRHPEAGGRVFVSSEEDRPVIVSRAMRPLVIGLVAFAAALGITLLLVMTQAITRQILIQAADYPTLRALGLSPRQLTFAATLPAAVSVTLGALIGVGIAIAASPLTPIGASRLAEPHPGIAIDGTVLVIGAVALVLFLAATAILPARRAAHLRGAAGERSTGGRSRIADALARAGAPASVSAGVRMALEPGSGSSAVPVRTVLTGAMVSMIALTAAYTFGGSLDRAVRTPSSFGQRWDRIVDAQFESLETRDLRLDDPSYAAVAGGAYSPGLLVVNGRSIPAIAIDQLKGSSTFPTLLEGRPPRTAGEIVLGTSTLHLLHARIGEGVTVAIAGTPVHKTVVGRAVFPAFGIGGLTPTGLGDGAALTVAGLGDQTFLQPGQYSFLLVRFAPHAGAAAIRRIDGLCGPIDQAGGLCLRMNLQQPPEIASYAQVRGVPWLLAALLAALAAATLGHGLLATVRRRRRDLAILKTLGFVRRQISSAVAWQSTTLAVFALVGIPLGVATGRWAWTSLTGQLGIAAEPRVPLLAVLLTIPASVLLANVVAALPARAASRTSAAFALRTE